MAAFVNPYNFVRSEYNAHKTTTPLTHERWHLEQYSGRLECALTTITRVTTKSFEPKRGLCIYGSTLKGMLRAVAEAIAQGCFTLGGTACQRVDRLCICCRIFGWLKGGNVHLGRVYINDATPRERNWLDPTPTYIEQQALASPRQNHWPFYNTSDDRPRGRKFYYHHNPSGPEQKLASHGSEENRMYIAKAGAIFSFYVDFVDLTSSELGLLLYALLLEDGLYHKLGKAKPLGFGTIRITLESLNLCPSNRYEQWEASPTTVAAFPAQELGLVPWLQGDIPARTPVEIWWMQLSPEQKTAAFIQARCESFFQEHFQKTYTQRFDHDMSHMHDMRHILSRHDAYPIHYPSQTWFNNNPGVSLPTIQEVEGNPPGDRRAWLQE